MKKNKIGVVFAITALSLGSFSAVFAEGLSTDVNVGINSEIDLNHDRNDTVHASGNIFATTTREGGDQNDENDNDDSRENDQNTASSTSHGRMVSAFVKNLLSVSDREGGIGAEVRVIAREQDDSSERISSSMSHIEGKGKFSSFLFGADYKNIAALQIEIVKMGQQITQLQVLADKATDVNDKDVLNVQIKMLQDEQVRLQTFVNLYENNFSMFGWLVRIFN